MNRTSTEAHFFLISYLGNRMIRIFMNGNLNFSPLSVAKLCRGECVRLASGAQLTDSGCVCRWSASWGRIKIVSTFIYWFHFHSWAFVVGLLVCLIVFWSFVSLFVCFLFEKKRCFHLQPGSISCQTSYHVSANCWQQRTPGPPQLRETSIGFRALRSSTARKQIARNDCKTHPEVDGKVASLPLSI